MHLFSRLVKSTTDARDEDGTTQSAMTFNYRAIYPSFRGGEFILLAAAGWDVEIYDRRMDGRYMH